MQHHPHSQGPTASQHHPQHSRPSIVHQQHHQAPSAQSQHPSAYSSHSIQPYQASSHSTNGQHTQDLPYYAQQSPYSTPGTTSGYTSAGESSTRRVLTRQHFFNSSGLHQYRYIRYDGCSPDSPTISTHLSYAAVKFSRLSRIILGP